MSLFKDPQEHAANPPSSWVVVRQGRRYALQTASGVTLDTFERAGHASDARTSGHLVTLYDKERRWYAGENVAGWRPYAECFAARKPQSVNSKEG